MHRGGRGYKTADRTAEKNRRKHSGMRSMREENRSSLYVQLPTKNV